MEKDSRGSIGGIVDLSRINSENIEQIEIVKGASSTLYGSDAIAGVINIITKKVETTNYALQIAPVLELIMTGSNSIHSLTTRENFQVRLLFPGNRTMAGNSMT